jgi:hypothetical protein
MSAAAKFPRLLGIAYDEGGIDAVHKLVKAFGGRRMFIPSLEHLAPNHVLSVVAGRRVAEAICKAMGPAHTEFPKGHGVINLVLGARLFAEGKNYNQVQAALGITWDGARKLKKRIKGAGGAERLLADFGQTPTKEPRRAAQLDIEDFTGAPAARSR